MPVLHLLPFSTAHTLPFPLHLTLPTSLPRLTLHHLTTSSPHCLPSSTSLYLSLPLCRVPPLGRGTSHHLTACTTATTAIRAAADAFTAPPCLYRTACLPPLAYPPARIPVATRVADQPEPTTPPSHSVNIHGGICRYARRAPTRYRLSATVSLPPYPTPTDFATRERQTGTAGRCTWPSQHAPRHALHRLPPTANGEQRLTYHTDDIPAFQPT